LHRTLAALGVGKHFQFIHFAVVDRLQGHVHVVSGLGLSISYGIIRDTGGEITVTNTGDGARFVITLPACEEDTAAA